MMIIINIIFLITESINIIVFLINIVAAVYYCNKLQKNEKKQNSSFETKNLNFNYPYHHEIISYDDEINCCLQAGVVLYIINIVKGHNTVYFELNNSRFGLNFIKLLPNFIFFCCF